MSIDEMSIHEMRRRAPMHYWAKADNARFAAYVLWSVSSEAQANAAETPGYGGITEIALHESFRREAVIALELIVKAVIAQRIELGIAMEHVRRVRLTHNLPSLWADAELPTLPDDDQHRLLIAKSILIWSGRYAAPKEDQVYEQEKLDEQGLEDIVSDNGQFKIIRPRSFSWKDMDRIYQVASNTLWSLRKEPNGVV